MSSLRPGADLGKRGLMSYADASASGDLFSEPSRPASRLRHSLRICALRKIGDGFSGGRFVRGSHSGFPA